MNVTHICDILCNRAVINYMNKLCALAIIMVTGIILLACDTSIPEKPAFTVAFDTHGGVPVPQPIKVEQHNSLFNCGFTLPAAPEKDPPQESAPGKAVIALEASPGEKFGGWFTEKNGGGTRFTAATIVTGDITVFAHWIATNELLMGNFTGQVKDYSNFIVRNVYDDGSKAATVNYTASVSGPNSGGINPAFSSGNSVTVNFTSTENTSKTASMQTTVSKNLANTGLPVVYIDTRDNAAINSKETYVKTNIRIASDSFNMTSSDYPHEIRGRGNTTWNYDKKPYRIKFNSNIPLFGLTAAKSWVLLANYKDYTLLTATAAFELARRLQVPAANHAIHVDVVLNGQYNGSYVLTEHVQVNPGRVNIDARHGYLVEFDTNTDTDFNFTTATSKLPTWVKSPEDLAPADYQFVIDSVNEFDRLLNSSSSGFPNNGYKELLNINSFINYFMVYEVTRNRELHHPKSAYMHKNANGLITMGPAWDFDWAYGMDGNKTVDVTLATGRIRDSSSTSKFYRFFADPEFSAQFNLRWNEKHGEIASIPDYIDSMAGKIAASESLDSIRWFSGNVNYPYEIGKFKKFLTDRIAWLHADINP